MAILATVLISSATNTTQAWGNGRSVVAGRQQVQAALAVAMADGALSKWEMYSILRKGKKALPPSELQGLQRRLDLLYGGEGSPTSAPMKRQERIVSAPTVVYEDEQGSSLPTLVYEGAGEPTVVYEDMEGPVLVFEDAGNSSLSTSAFEGDYVEQSNTQPAGDPQAETITQTGLIAEDEEESAATALYDPPVEPTDVDSPFKEEFTPETIPQGLQEGVSQGDLQHFEVYDDFKGPEVPMGDRLAIYAEKLGGLFASGIGKVSTRSCSPHTIDFPDIRFSSSVDAFKGPMDLDDLNGNFGFRWAVNAGFPMVERWGIGWQAGTSAVVSNFHGSQFTGSRTRSQYFTTVGMFHRLPWAAERLKYGFAYDWLNDRYYWPFRLSQWRVKLAYEWSPSTEFGIWACIPNDGDTARIDHGPHPVTGEPRPPSYETFKPVGQGSLYLRRCWSNGFDTTVWLGLVEEPGEFVVGSDARLPFGSRWAFFGSANYVHPSASGKSGRDEEMWNLSLGIEFKLGGGNHCVNKRNSPLLPLADNGTFAIRRF